jgi:hypothetical protein
MIFIFQSIIVLKNDTCSAKKAFFFHIQFSLHDAQVFQKFSIRRYLFHNIQQRYIDPHLLESFKDFRIVIDFSLFGYGMRK